MAEGKVIVTGINGFVGEHVAREFTTLGFDVIGVGHDTQPHPKLGEVITDYVQCNLLDGDSVNRLDLSETKALIHLAGLSNVGDSFLHPVRYISENPIMTFNLLEKAAADRMPGRAVIVSTGALYDQASPLPLSEKSPTKPGSPYAVGKLSTEDVADYFRSRGLDTVSVRPFNHIGPGQGQGFILPDLFKQLSEADETIVTGNIDTKRDYTDVRDIARAYGKIALTPSLHESLYNICSGRSLSGREILTLLQAAMDKQTITSVVDPNKIRPNDTPDIYGDASRLSEELSWHPEIDIEQTITDFIASAKK